jgi:ABC-type iron transport system FetAB ATPase subunit
MDAVIEAVDLVAGDRPARPTSIRAQRGEILGLLTPRGPCRTPLLRALGKLEPPRAGAVRHAPRTRVAIAPSEILGEVLASRPEPDLLLVDALGEGDPRSLWSRLAAERARGATVVVATEIEDQA